MVMGVPQAMKMTHLVDASAGSVGTSAPAKAMLDRLNKTSAALWPAAKQLPALNSHALPLGSRQVYVPPSQPQLQLGHHVDRTNQQFAQGVTGQLKTLTNAVKHGTYDVVNGVLGGLPNRTLERWGDAAPPWAQELVKHNQTQWEADGRTAMNALRALPQAAQDVGYQSLGLAFGPAGALTALAAGKWAPDGLRQWGHGQLSAAQGALSTLKGSWAMPSMEGVLHQAGQSTPTALGEGLVAVMLATVSRGQSGKNQLQQILKDSGSSAKDVATKNITTFKSNDSRKIVVIKDPNDPTYTEIHFTKVRTPEKAPPAVDTVDLSNVFRQRFPNVFTFSDVGHRTTFQASVHTGGSMKIGFSTHPYAESLDAPGRSGPNIGRVTHRYGNGSGQLAVSMPNGDFALAGLAARSSDMQAQLFGAALKRFDKEGVRIHRVELDHHMLSNAGWQNVSTVLKGFETSLQSTPALQSQVAKNLERAVFETPLGKTAFRQGFYKVKPRVSASGQIEGIVLIRANTPS